MSPPCKHPGCRHPLFPSKLPSAAAVQVHRRGVLLSAGGGRCQPAIVRNRVASCRSRRGSSSMARGIQAGDKAPDFTLPSQTGEPVRLSDRLGERSVVLYFYPKDDTPGCTAEACAFRDSYEVFADAGAEVIGISSDSVDKHAAFADHHKLPFTLLSDKGGQVRKRYGSRRWPVC